MATDNDKDDPIRQALSELVPGCQFQIIRVSGGDPAGSGWSTSLKEIVARTEIVSPNVAIVRDTQTPKVKVAELTGAHLDYWAARANGREASIRLDTDAVYVDGDVFSPSSRWDHGGPIIEREHIHLIYHTNVNDDTIGEWLAWTEPSYLARFDLDMGDERGPTPLVAAMRAFVASKFGEEVDDATALTKRP